MSKNYQNQLIVFGFLTTITFGILLLGMMFAGPNLVLPEYFSNDEHYETLSGVVDRFYLNDDDSLSLVLNHNTEDFGKHFIVRGNNYFLIKEKGLIEELTVGSNLEIISAPGYFGDGWDYPIVEIKADDKIYLDYEDGKNNIVEEYQQAKKNYLIFLYIAVPIFIVNGSLFVLFFIQFQRNKIAHKFSNY